MDVSALSNEELATLLATAEAEKQRRNSDQRLKDSAWALVMGAKNAGYTKGQVSTYLANVVRQAYGEPQA